MVQKQNFTIRLDPELKKASRMILEPLGLDFSTAISIFLIQVVKKKGLPFIVSSEESEDFQV